MDWKKLFRNRKTWIGIGVLLVLAILIALLISSCDGRLAQLEDPLGDMDEMSQIQVEETTGDEAQEETEPETTEQEETKPASQKPENSDKTAEEDNTQSEDKNDAQGAEDGTNSVDLALELQYQKKDGSTGYLTCAADGTVEGAIENYELTDGKFAYTAKLVGESADDAKLTSAQYSGTSGEEGTLGVASGTISFKLCVE